MDDDALVLYILMRTDLASLNPGKAMAQANHAFGALKAAIRSDHVRQRDYLAWQETTAQDFGTVIVLGGNEGGIQGALDRIVRHRSLVVSGWVHDPTYPIRDGELTHLIPLNTCAFVFGTKAECVDMCESFELHP
jgi:hypothetical protein